AADLNKQYGSIQEAFIAIFPPPPVQGIGTVAGFKLYIEDRGGMGLESLYKETTSTLQKGNQTPGLAGVFSSFDINVPQIDSHVIRRHRQADLRAGPRHALQWISSRRN